MILSRFFKLDRSVEKSREGIFSRIASVFEQPRPIDDDLWDELEELLLQADVGELTKAFHRGFLLTGAVAALAAFTASRIPHIELWPARVRRTRETK